MDTLLLVGALLLVAAICFGLVLALGRRNRKRGAFDASRTLGSSQIAGTMVNELGWAKSWARQMNPLSLGPLRDRVLRRPKLAPSSTTPPFGAHGLVAVTASEVALIELVLGWTGPRQTAVVARVPRCEVVSAELGRGVNAPLTLSFANGDTWQFEVGRTMRKDARAVIGTLSANATGS